MWWFLLFVELTPLCSIADLARTERLEDMSVPAMVVLVGLFL